MRHKITSFIRHKRKTAIAIALVLLVMFGFVYFRSKQNGHVETIRVTRGAIAEEVIVTGKTEPIQALALAFQNTGRVTRVSVSVGDRVASGEILATLDQRELLAEREQAIARVEIQTARLLELKRGTRPEDLRIKETELAQAERDLENKYQSVTDVLHNSYIDADDAVRVQLNDLFSKDEESDPQITFSVRTLQKETDAESGRAAVRNTLNTWKTELASIGPTSSHALLENALTDSKAHLQNIQIFTDLVMDALLDSISLSETTLAAYKADVTAAKTAVNTALTDVNNHEQDIASEALAVRKMKDEFARDLAGTPSEQIAAQEAEVRQAEAQLLLAEAKLAKTVLRSPIQGVVTRQDAKIGEIVSAGTAVVSIISEGGLQIEANVPEVDIGKLMRGNRVRITLDAFPGEQFGGTVIHVDPAETIIDGVTNFEIKIAFDTPDPRIKSGLTANLNIETLRKENVLLLPQYAILETDEGTFARKITGGTSRETTVTTGIRGEDGMVEIVSGLSEGDEVENVGAE